MKTIPTTSRLKFGWAAGLSLWTMLALAGALQALATDQPPPLAVAAAGLHAQFPALHGQVLSLKYIRPLNSYRLRLMSSEGQLISYDQDARTGRLLGFRLGPASTVKGPDGLPTLEALLGKVFGGTRFQLLKAELIDDQAGAQYQLDWVQEDTLFHAHFDARSGALLASAP